MDSETPAPMPVFISYAPKDESYRKELETYLAPLQRRGFITVSHQGTVGAGSQRRQELDAALDTARLILLLMSAHYEASDECAVDRERVLARYHSGNAVVIPLLLRPVSLEDTELADLQCLPRNGLPITHYSGSDRDEVWEEIVREIRSILKKGKTQPQRNEERTRKLKAMVADHRGFMRDRLNSFVGRQSELADIQQHINNTMKTGGYVTITGQAGQGKSSIIAKLVEQTGSDLTAFHFIPLKPGPDHQVGLLRNLMARLILKYDLSDLYVASDSRAALRDYFPKVLQDVVAQGKQEVIFIDGLDQLEEDLNGYRDLSFLPNDTPAGIVFVLGTRPDDTLRPLELLKPFDEYRLPNLSRQDFDLILAHRQVQLERTLVDQFYEAMKQNALYLDLGAKELVQTGQIAPAALIARVAHDPCNLFSLAITRLKRQPLEWREVIKPTLGLLLAAREPLKLRQIRSILQVEDERLRDGLQRLGGLLTDAGLQGYTLFHLKLRDYLRQNEQDLQKDYVFATDEEEGWHAKLAAWCEQAGLACIWEDTWERGEQERRQYARKHVIAHLYYAHQWDHLFEILDEGSYGHAKERYDVTTRSYIEDLDFGRRAAAWDGWTQEEALTHFPRLWQYTLLRCSLRSRSDNYPDELFRLMLLLGREQEVLGHVELLTNAEQKSRMFQIMADHIANQPGRQAEQWQMLQRSCEVALAIPEKDRQGIVLRRLVQELVEMERWEQAQEMAFSITDSDQKAWALKNLATALAKAERWEQAQAIIHSITESNQKAWAMRDLAEALAKAGKWEQAEETVHAITESYQQASVLNSLVNASAKLEKWEQAEHFWQMTREATYSVSGNNRKMQALIEFANASVRMGKWEQAETAWQMAEGIAYSITESREQIRVLVGLAKSLANAGKQEKADSLYLQATKLISSITSGFFQTIALSELAGSLAEAGKWEQAETMWKEANEMAHSFGGTSWQASALTPLVTSLVKAKQWKQAEEVAHSIPQSKEKASALSQLGIAIFKEQSDYAKIMCIKSEDQTWIGEIIDYKAIALNDLLSVLKQAKRWDQVEEVARFIVSTDPQTRASSTLVEALVREERWTQAEEVARSIINTDHQVMALRRLVGALVQAERWGQAEEVVHSIVDNDAKALILGYLANVLFGVKRLEQAEFLWKQAIEVAHFITNDERIIRVWVGLWETLVEAKQWEQAESLWKIIEGVAHSIPDICDKTGALSRFTTILDSAGQLVEAKQWEQAESLWKIIEEVAHSIPGSYGKTKALSRFATILDSVGQKERAELLWKQAEEVTQSIFRINEQARAMRELVESLAGRKRWKQAEEVARSIAESDEQAVALRMLAEELIKAKQWSQAEEIAHSIKDRSQKSIAFGELGIALADAEQWQMSEETLPLIEQESEQVKALSMLAVALSKAEKWEQAEHFWKRAEKVAHSSDVYERSPALKSIAVSLAQAQQWKRAEEVAHSITEGAWQGHALAGIVEALLTSGNHEMIFAFVRRWCLYVEAQDAALGLFSAAVQALVTLSSDMGIALYKSFQWVDAFLSGKKQ